MKYVRTLILSGAVLSLATTGVVFAQNADDGDQPAAAAASSNSETSAKDSGRRMHHRHGGWMMRKDANNDGAIQQDEMGRVDDLKKADADGDGVLSRKEIEDMVLQRLVERRAKRMERKLDIDGDGKVTLAEIEDHQAKRFALMDRNNDGKLERSEFKRGHGFGRHHHGRHHRGKHFGHHGGFGPRG